MLDIGQTSLAFIEGLGLAISPCILPVLPFILAASTGKSNARPFLIIAGFILSFTVFSLVARQILAVTGIQQDAIQMGAYVLLLIFGLVMVIPYLEKRFARLTGGLADKAQSMSMNTRDDSVSGGLLIGALIGVVWTPCAGPILAAALLQTIQAKTSFDAFTTILAFGTGAGIPMLAIALFGQKLTKHFRGFAKHATTIRRVMGVIIMGFAMLGLVGFNIGEYVALQTAKNNTIQVAALPDNTLQDALKTPYPAPAIAGIKQWFNSDALTTEGLKGKVVLIDFWTYSCINCIRTLPHIKDWAAKYKDDGLVVIGVHAPEFAFEGVPENVSKALTKFGITYPVALDNDFTTWKNFANKYWPAHYLINKEGQVVYIHFGEGNYDITEHNIRLLLGLGKTDELASGAAPISKDQTPETYLGTARAKAESTSSELALNNWVTNGNWKRMPDYIEAGKAGDKLTLRYNARKVYLVMESASGKPVTAQINNNEKPSATDDVKDGMAMVDASQLYQLISNPAKQDGKVTITAMEPGLRLYAFTFES